MYILEPTIELEVPESGNCGEVRVAVCNITNANRLQIEIAGFDPVNQVPNTHHNISVGPFNISRCDDHSTYRFCIEYETGSAVDGLSITCSANGKGWPHVCINL